MHFFILTLLFLLGGCTAHQSAPLQSSVKVPAKLSQPQLHVKNNWFEELNDNDLNVLIETALKHNRNLKVARENIKAASAILRQTRSSQALTLEGTAKISRTFQDASDDSNSFSATLSASYELDLWGRLDALENASVFDFNASEQEFHAAAISISAEVALAWYRLLEQHAQLKLLNKQTAINEQYLQLLVSRFNISNVHAADIIQQRQVLVALEGERELAASYLKQYQTLLALLLGTDLSNLHVNLEQPFNAPATPYVIDSANLLQRPDVQAAFFKVHAANERVSASISNSYPRVSITTTLSGSSEKIKNIFQDWIASLAANLSAPILDGGRRAAEVKQQEAYARSALYAYEQTLLQALKEVADAQSSLSHRHAYLQSIKKQLILAKASVKHIREQYVHGSGDFLRLLSAQLSHEKLERTYLQAHRELIEADITLHRCVAAKISPQSLSGELQ